MAYGVWSLVEGAKQRHALVLNRHKSKCVHALKEDRRTIWLGRSRECLLHKATKRNPNALMPAERGSETLPPPIMAYLAMPVKTMKFRNECSGTNIFKWLLWSLLKTRALPVYKIKEFSSGPSDVEEFIDLKYSITTMYRYRSRRRPAGKAIEHQRFEEGKMEGVRDL